ncbi:MAG: hypothetical protein M5U26_09090 [Planctomycetota bacterium]|nr:hypothetical protein [Planctomycetota bacterium]
MVDGFAALLGGLDVDAQVLDDARLPDEVVEAPRAQRGLEGVLVVAGAARARGAARRGLLGRAGGGLLRAARGPGGRAISRASGRILRPSNSASARNSVRGQTV